MASKLLHHRTLLTAPLPHTPTRFVPTPPLSLTQRVSPAPPQHTDENAPKLKLGYIGVVNRSQKDIIDHRSIGDAREKEAQYFASEPAYRSLFARMGTQHLVTRCSEQLVQVSL